VLASASYLEAADRALAHDMGASAFVVRTPDFHDLIAALLDSLETAPTPAVPDTSESLSQDHVDRVVRQLELQTTANAVLAQNAALQAAQLAILAGVSDILVNNKDVEQVLDEVLARCLDGAGTSSGVVYLADPSGWIGPRAQVGYAGEAKERLANFFGHADLLYRAMDQGEPIAVRSDQVSEALANDLLEGAGAESLLLTPLIASEERLGVVVMAWRKRELDHDWIAFAKAVGYQLSQAIALGRTIARLAASEQRYRDLVQDLDAIVWEMDLATQRFLFVSRRAEDLLGYPVEQWYAEPGFLLALVHPDDRDQLAASLRSVVALEQEHTLELRAISASSRTAWFRASMHLARDEGARPGRIRGLLIDITEQKRLEEQFRQSQKMEAIGRLAGGVAHDFNNLLTAIGGYAQLLLDDFDSSDRRRGDIEEISKAADRAAGLTRQLLAFSRRQLLAPQVLELNSVVVNMDKLLRRLIGEDVELIVSLERNLPPVKADLGQIEQVILNLVVNARDAMPEGGRITLTTVGVDLGPKHPDWSAALATGHYVALTVVDTGQGMDAATRARIFEPFFTTKDPGKGTGLGLSTVYGIVQQSGGGVVVASEVGRGACFTVYLPATAEEMVLARGDDEQAPDRPGFATVLLVEDEQGVRELACRVLRQRGYTVLEAGDGTAALELAKSYPAPIDMLVTDLVMPGMGGRTLAAQLRELRSDLRVLYISGYSAGMPDTGQDQDNAAGFLHKPFTPHQLAAVVAKLLHPHDNTAALNR
jgi:PAS domain S-box-containing protein